MKTILVALTALTLTACATLRAPASAATETTSSLVCQKGYELDRDGRRCVPIEEPAEFYSP